MHSSCRHLSCIHAFILQVYPDFGPGSISRVGCFDYALATGEVYTNNTCVLHGDPSHVWCDGETQCGLISIRSRCADMHQWENISDPQLLLPLARDNKYYVPNANNTRAIWWFANLDCELNGTLTLAELQVRGGESGSAVLDTAAMPAERIVAMGEALIYAAD
jgi:hypothetical protein